MTRKRYGILSLIFICVVINYMDRSNISVAAFAVSEDLGLDTVGMGLLFSAFSWTYVALQIPGGLLADLVKPRYLYSVLLTLWSLATLLQGFANSLIALMGLRMSIGVFEAPSYPTNNRIVTQWFPEGERASAIAVYTSGQYIGLAFLTPVLFLILEYVGWRWLFIVSGLAGIIFAGIWYAYYRNPEDHPGASEEELAHIRAGGGLVDGKAQGEVRTPFNRSDLRQVFTSRKLWGIYIGQFCIGSLFVFFLTWFPTYLVKFRGLDFIKSGFLASIPFLAAFAGVLLSGFVSDYLIRSGRSSGFARKAPVLTGCLLSMSIVGANYTESTGLVIFFLALAFFGNGLASITWIFVSSMAPRHLIGLTGGVFNAIGGLSAITIPVIIGFLAKDGNFEPALLFIGFLTVLGFLSFIFLVGRVERIDS